MMRRGWAEGGGGEWGAGWGEGRGIHRKLITGQQQGIDCANKGELIMIQRSSGLRCKNAYLAHTHSAKGGYLEKKNHWSV